MHVPEEGNMYSEGEKIKGNLENPRPGVLEIHDRVTEEEEGKKTIAEKKKKKKAISEKKRFAWERKKIEPSSYSNEVTIRYVVGGGKQMRERNDLPRKSSWEKTCLLKKGGGGSIRKLAVWACVKQIPFEEMNLKGRTPEIRDTINHY